MELDLLIEMYKTFSPSFFERKMIKIVSRELHKMNIPFTRDIEGNIYRFIENTPLLCAHMDQVGHEKVTKIKIKKGLIKGNKNLGADDKNGVWINLNLLKEFDISFIFSTGEEAGGNIRSLLEDNKEILKTIKYGLVFDRRNGSDIIGTCNSYCCDDFEKDLLRVGEKFGYKSSSGIFSDCDNLSEHIACVNLSCGYYQSHTNKEYTNISELYNALKFGKEILSTLDKKYEVPDISERYIYTYYKNYKGGTATTNWYETYWDKLFFCEECHEYIEEQDVLYDSAHIEICPICLTLLIEIEMSDLEEFDDGVEGEVEDDEEFERGEDKPLQLPLFPNTSTSASFNYGARVSDDEEIIESWDCEDYEGFRDSFGNISKGNFDKYDKLI